MPYVFSLIGSWPDGIVIDPDTGVVSGTPTESGTFTGLSVRVTDDAMNTADLPTFSLAVAIGPSVGLATGTSEALGIAPYASVGSAAGVGTAAAVGESEEGDLFWDDVLFLSGFEGLNGYNSPMLDDTGQWLINRAAGSGQLSTSRFEDGGSAHYTNSAGQGYSTPRDTLWGLVPTAASEFTFEFSVNWQTPVNGGDLITLDGAGGAESWIRIDGSTGHLRMLGSKTGSGFPVDYTSSGGTITPGNTWNKYAIEKNAAGKYRTYINGVMRGSQTVLDTLYSAADLKMWIGSGFNTPQNVWIDNMRITLAARYDDDGGYTPTSGVFPTGAMRSNWAYRSSANDTTDGTSYSFTSMAIGNNADDYRLVVAVIHWGFSTARTLTSATIGGVAATIVGQVNNGGGFRGIAIVQASVPTGTTATVAVTFSGTVLRCLVDVYSGLPVIQSALDSRFVAYSGLGSGVTATYSDTEGAAGGITIIGTSSGDTTDAATWTQSGSEAVVQDYQAGVESGRYGAFHILNTDTTPLNDLTLALAGGSGHGGVMAIASYGGVVPAILYTHAAEMTSGGTGTDNFSNVNIGAARSDRVVVVYVMHSHTLAAVNDSLTVNGVSMTEAPGGGVSASGGNVGDLHAWYGSVPSGTSVTVSVHFTTVSNSFINIWVYSLYGSPALLDTVRVTGGSAGTSIDFSDLDTMTGGPVVVCGYSVGSGSPTVTGTAWTGPETFAADFNDVCRSSNHSAFTGHFTAASDGAGTDDIAMALNSSRVNAGIALSFIPVIVTSSVGLAAGTSTANADFVPAGSAIGIAAGTGTATGISPVTITYIGELTPGTPTNGSSATLDVGAVPGLVVVAINISRSTGTQKVTSATINGESGIVQGHTLTSTRVSAIVSKTTMTDTGSIPIVVTYNGTTATLRGSVYKITGLTTARPLDVEAPTFGNNPSITLAIEPNGALIAAAVNNDNTMPVTFSAGIDTQDYNAVIGSFSARGVGRSLTTTSNASYTVTASSGAGSEWIAGASWDTAALGSRIVYWYGVGLLCHFDGTDAATSSTDSSIYAHTLTFGGNAQLDTAKTKFGVSSVLLDGTGDYVSTPITTDLYLAGFDFTIECWAAFHSVAAAQITVLSNYTASGSQRAWFFQWEQSLTKLRFAWYPDGVTFDFLLDSSVWTPTIDQFYHLRVDRKNGVFRMYIDGVMVASNSSFTTSVLFESTAPVMIGGINATTGNFNGWIDEPLILKGLALCGSDAGFTPPTSAYTAVSAVGGAAGVGTAAAVSTVGLAIGSATGTATATAVSPAPPWTPYDILSQVWAWWDFSTMPEADTVAVATVTDGSGNSRTLTTSGSPTAKANAQNSLKGLNFAGGAKYATFASMSSLSSGSIFAVNKAAASPASTSHGGLIDAGSDSQINHYTYSGVVYSDFMTNSRKTAGAVTVNVWHQVLLWSASGDWGHAMDGTDKYTTASNTVAGLTTTSYLAGGSNTSWLHQGEFGEVVLLPAKLSTTDREKMEGYLAHKWGLTASLPALHPYKTTAPVSPGIPGTARLDAQYVETISTGTGNTVRLGDQYAEVVGTGSGNLVQLGDQYAEVIGSGSGNLVQLGDQYVEVIVPYP